MASVGRNPPGIRRALNAALDASSALLAYLRDEPGAEAVDRALKEGAAVSAVNWAEALSKLAERGQDPEDTIRALAGAGPVWRWRRGPWLARAHADGAWAELEVGPRVNLIR